MHSQTLTRTPRLMAFVIGTIVGLAALPAVAAPTVVVDGATTSVPAVVRGSQVFVPVRGVFEKLNTAVNFMPPSSVVATKARTDLARMTLGSRESTVLGQPHQLSNAPFREGQHIYVPLRLISQAAGATVAYSAADHVVRITSARPVVAAAPVPVVTDAPAPVEQPGIPWWAWLLLALLVLAIIFALLTRRPKPDPLITTRSTPTDPNNSPRR